VLLDANLRSLSFELKARKPSERLFRHVLQALEPRGIAPPQVLHIGSRMNEDLIPARKLGMRTGLFAGDRDSLQVTAEQLKDPASRPDVLLTELTQIADIVREA
jgi:FMN phosphatase YigB (HAD superfamily)